jgi:tetratricopeptide (TPR) repeat protein
MPRTDVVLREEGLTIPTYCLGPAERNPVLYSGRGYQGAKGPVYPYPMLDRLSDVREDRTYRAVRLENQYLQVIALPEIGGRILAARDKTNGYDFFYRQHVIKPALIGVLGAWISGGVEWNLPHHHRASTFMPVDHCLSNNPDGSKTLWVGETELRHRMRWIVGMTLHPDRSYLHVQTKLFNRTPFAHSFLYFSNAAVSVNDDYQVIFPPTTHFGTQHAKHEFVHWPIAREVYAGVDYSAGVDVSWWKNHPSHVSIFAWNDKEDFFGGYDHGRAAGVCHVADHHAAPGKKFFEFGNGPAGRTWDKILTDDDGPYLELMAGAYSDNQPDYSWIQPGETKTITEYWYPIRGLGGIKNANREAAVDLEVDSRNIARVAFNATAEFRNATILLQAGGRTLTQESVRIAPDSPIVREVPLPQGVRLDELCAALLASDGRELIAYRPVVPAPAEMPKPVVPPAAPQDVPTNEELYLAGLRLEQFHSPAQEPYPYYEEALRRDPCDARANTALGILYCKRGIFAEASERLQSAVQRLTANYTRPKDGEPHYYLGVAARALHQYAVARDAFGRAAWSFAWRSASHLALAEMAMAEGDLEMALSHVTESIAHNALNPKALNLEAAILRNMGRAEESAGLAEQVLAIDPLDFWARNERMLALRAVGRGEQAGQQSAESGALLRNVPESYLELAFDYANCRQWGDAIEVLTRFLGSAPDSGKVNPMVHYTLAFYWEQKGDPAEAARHYRLGRQSPRDYCFPFQFESSEVLRAAMRHDPRDGTAPFYLGNLLYDLQPAEATRAWERARELDSAFATVHRNLALAYARAEHDLPKAIASMRRAVECDPRDARLLAELDELLEAQGADHSVRLAILEHHHSTVLERDDGLLREARLHVFVGQYDRAIELLADRHFHIWEGGENSVHNVYVDAHLLRGRAHLAAGRCREALADFQAASEYPERFERGEPYDGGRAPEVSYYIGVAREACGDDFRPAYERAVARDRRGTYLAFYQGLAWRKLGQEAKAAELFDDLLEAGARMTAGGSVGRFFEKFGFGQTESARRSHGHYLTALGLLGKGESAEAKRELQTAVRLNVNHLAARTELVAMAQEW